VEAIKKRLRELSVCTEQAIDHHKSRPIAVAAIKKRLREISISVAVIAAASLSVWGVCTALSKAASPGRGRPPDS
jgi:hypothetical protein